MDIDNISTRAQRLLWTLGNEAGVGSLALARFDAARSSFPTLLSSPMRALNRQAEGSGLAQSAAYLSGRQSHLNKLQYAYVSRKMINFKKMHAYPLFP